MEAPSLGIGVFIGTAVFCLTMSISESVSSHSVWKRTNAIIQYLEVFKPWHLAVRGCGALRRKTDKNVGLRLDDATVTFSALGLTLFCGSIAVRSIMGGICLCCASLALLCIRGAISQRKELEQLRSAFPYSIRKLSVALESGASFERALLHASSNCPQPLGTELEKAAAALRYGLTPDEVIYRLTERLPQLDFKLLGESLLVSKKTGAPVSGILAHVSHVLTSRLRLSRSLEVKTAQMRLSASMVASLPPFMTAVLWFISSDYRVGVATIQGVGTLGVAAVLDVTALIWMRHMMREVA